MAMRRTRGVKMSYFSSPETLNIAIRARACCKVKFCLCGDETCRNIPRIPSARVCSYSGSAQEVKLMQGFLRSSTNHSHGLLFAALTILLVIAISPGSYAQSYSVLYNFASGLDNGGAFPYAGLTMDSQGNLYARPTPAGPVTPAASSSSPIAAATGSTHLCISSPAATTEANPKLE